MGKGGTASLRPGLHLVTGFSQILCLKTSEPKSIKVHCTLIKNEVILIPFPLFSILFHYIIADSCVPTTKELPRIPPRDNLAQLEVQGRACRLTNKLEEKTISLKCQHFGCWKGLQAGHTHRQTSISIWQVKEWPLPEMVGCYITLSYKSNKARATTACCAVLCYSTDLEASIFCYVTRPFVGLVLVVLVQSCKQTRQKPLDFSCFTLCYAAWPLPGKRHGLCQGKGIASKSIKNNSTSKRLFNYWGSVRLRMNPFNCLIFKYVSHLFVSFVVYSRKATLKIFSTNTTKKFQAQFSATLTSFHFYVKLSTVVMVLLRSSYMLLKPILENKIKICFFIEKNTNRDNIQKNNIKKKIYMNNSEINRICFYLAQLWL
ncbi:hypothetical protein VP01_995g1 [Puccinia sorghi]|uniref:Uncharacterized protein n=1 Tax=Puccinia sorghi TaxID=27349 RepID=A0A0L6U5R9_9BASI|nr:hypothetical protein VP01_995g1 [Puccinia sorghi]